jgi:hypothetical protein
MWPSKVFVGFLCFVLVHDMFLLCLFKWKIELDQVACGGFCGDGFLSWICSWQHATAFALAPVVPLLCQPTQIRRPQIDGSTIRASSPAPPTSLPTIAPVLDPLEWWWPIACEPVSGVPRRSGFPANEQALNLVVRAVGMRPCKLFSETLKVSRLVRPPRVPGMELLSLLFPRSNPLNLYS